MGGQVKESPIASALSVWLMLRVLRLALAGVGQRVGLPRPSTRDEIRASRLRLPLLPVAIRQRASPAIVGRLGAFLLRVGPPTSAVSQAKKAPQSPSSAAPQRQTTAVHSPAPARRLRRSPRFVGRKLAGRNMRLASLLTSRDSLPASGPRSIAAFGAMRVTRAREWR